MRLIMLTDPRNAHNVRVWALPKPPADLALKLWTEAGVATELVEVKLSWGMDATLYSLAAPGGDVLRLHGAFLYSFGEFSVRPEVLRLAHPELFPPAEEPRA